MRMKTTLTNRPLLILLGGALICAASNVGAQTYSENYGSIDLGQGGASGTQAQLNNDCAAVATANGLSYLEGQYPNLFGNVSQDNYGTVNTLMSVPYMNTGTTGATKASTINGLQSYIAANGYTVASSQTVNPTYQFLASALQANEAVQLGVLWGETDQNGNFIPGYDNGPTGGHFISLTGINLTAGTMTFLDPWGANPSGSVNAASSAISITADFYVDPLNTGSGPNVLEVVWPTTYGPDDTTADNTTGASSFGSYHYPDGYVSIANIETVPEPSTISLLLLPFGAGVLRLLRKNRAA